MERGMRAYLDVETTGFSRGAGAVIIEVGAVLVDKDWNELACLSSIVFAPPKTMELKGVDKALAVNKITREQVDAGLQP